MVDPSQYLDLSLDPLAVLVLEDPLFVQYFNGHWHLSVDMDRPSHLAEVAFAYAL